MGLEGLGLVLSFFPVLGMKTTLALFHPLGIYPSARLLIITFVRMGRSLVIYRPSPVTYMAEKFQLPVTRHWPSSVFWCSYICSFLYGDTPREVSFKQ